MSIRFHPWPFDEVAGLFSSAARTAIAEGEWITPSNDEVLVLEEGELLHYDEDRLLDIVEPQRAVGLAEVLAQRPVLGRFQARKKSLLLRMSGQTIRAALHESPASRERILSLLAQAAVDHARERRDFALVFDDFFAPAPGAVLLPGPYRFGPYRATQLVMEATPSELDALLPGGLSRFPGFGGRYMIIVNDLRGSVCEHGASDGRSFEYREIVPFIPCISRSGKLGLYTPELYPSAYMPVLLGREIYGFPKRMARVSLGDRRVDLLADNVILLHAQWDHEAAMTKGELAAGLASVLLPSGKAFAGLPKMLDGVFSLAEHAGMAERPLHASVFVHQRLKKPDAQRVDDNAIDQLVEVPFVVTHVGDPIRLEGARVEAHAKSRVFPGRVLAGFSCSFSFRMDAGRVERNYLDKRARRGFFTRRVA